MDAPKRPVCGKSYWSRQPCPAQKEARLEHAREVLRQAEGVTKPVTKTSPDVTKIAVDSYENPPPVTKTRRGRPRLGAKPMTAAERIRRYRARKAPLP